MINLDPILLFYKNLSNHKITNIKTHNWIKKDIGTICEDCGVLFTYVLHDLNNKNLSQFSCEEIYIKNILE